MRYRFRTRGSSPSVYEMDCEKSLYAHNPRKYSSDNSGIRPEDRRSWYSSEPGYGEKSEMLMSCTPATAIRARNRTVWPSSFRDSFGKPMMMFSLTFRPAPTAPLTD